MDRGGDHAVMSEAGAQAGKGPWGAGMSLLYSGVVFLACSLVQAPGRTRL